MTKASTDSVNMCQCGCVDNKTGEWKEGVYKDGKVVGFKNPLPWWKRIFGVKAVESVWSEAEFVDVIHETRTMMRVGIFSGAKTFQTTSKASLYRITHRYTGEKKYFIVGQGGEETPIDGNAYEQTGQIVYR